MKRYIRGMADNKEDNVKSCVVPWVVYECYRNKIFENPWRKIKVTDNHPGKIIVLSGTKKHPNSDVLFQLTPKGRDLVQIEVVSDNFKITIDASTAVQTILSY